ncbi:MAG TPA: phenylalanine--tRNA ligase subunit beta [Methylomirabilota bacterium]|nr:phenylalanine--tRNA ligase subunit beta [Methylomirabilota bacterium]
MKIPYGWVREFVTVSLSPQEAADRLVNAGVEVAAVTPLAPAGLRGVVVGEIEAVERELGESRGHRLVLCRVRAGQGERFSVVCGAPNTRAGVRAAFAPPGASLPGLGGVTAKKVHGVESQGILCSERELGLGEEHEAGLLLVDGDAPVGGDLVKALGLDDHVLEIEITPNRPDCLSVLGVARELAALTGARLHAPRIRVKEGAAKVRDLARVRIEAPELCHRYTVRVIDGVRVAPSPAWMQSRLRAAGLRPISNVVDVTNYVLWELGHPLHAFDRHTLAEHTIVVRRARDGERFTTLDGQTRVLDAGMCVIADPARAVGLAGVMGGRNSEVTEATTSVLLESAWFDPGATRRTSRTLALKTDAAYRFERGADIEGLVDANDRAAQLIAELAGGTVARGLLDAYPRKRKPVRVRLRMSRVERVLGVAPPPAKARQILAGLQLLVRPRGRDLEVDVPSFRRDLAIEDDLVEEVIRVWGYHRIPTTFSRGEVKPARESDTGRQERLVREILVGAGLAECVTYAFSDPVKAAALGTARQLKLLNPLSQDAAALREHPLEGLLGVVATNLTRQQPGVRVFEVGRTYEPAAGGDTDTAEPRWVAIALAGARAEAAWHTPAATVDVFDAKGVAELVVAGFGSEPSTRSGGALPGFEPDSHATLLVGETVVGEFGEISASARAAFGIETPVFAAALRLDALPAEPRTPRHESLPRFPAVQRDLAFALGERPVTADAIAAAIRAEAGPLLRTLTVFDVFPLPDGRRSVAFRLTFQADDRTLTDTEVNAIHERVTQRVSAALGLTLRGA